MNLSKVVIEMGNEETYKDVLDEIAHSYYLDMLVVFKELVIDTPENCVSRLVTVEEVEELGFSKEAFLTMAIRNTERIRPSMLTNPFPGMTVLSNEKMMYGASALLYTDKLSEMSSALGKDLILIPSSIHEMIVLPDTDPDREALCNMIREANRTVCDKHEVLSDHPYRFDHKTQQLQVM